MFKSVITIATTTVLLLKSLVYPTLAISGGSFALEAEFPHQVFLITSNENGSLSYCAGSILDKYTIITAAHCIASANPQSSWIKAGVRNISLHGGGVGPGEYYLQEGFPSEFFPHPGWDIRGLSNDIGIILLKAPLHFNSHVRNIDLPRDGYEVAKGNVTVIGWGRRRNSSADDHDHDDDDDEVKDADEEELWMKRGRPLMKALMPVYGEGRCLLHNRELQWEPTVTAMCVGGNSSNACKGDSGGPAICQRQPVNETINPQNSSTLLPVPPKFLCGIASGSPECGRKGFSSYFTKVPVYLLWIEEIRKEISSRIRCNTEHFYCPTNNECLPRSLLCNNQTECEGFDEVGCVSWGECDEEDLEFRCGNGMCVPKRNRCKIEGYYHCKDKCRKEISTDGHGHCPGDHDCGRFDRCIPNEWRCDRIVDCNNGSDEWGCIHPEETDSSIISIEHYWLLVTILCGIGLMVIIIAAGCVVYIARCVRNRRRIRRRSRYLPAPR